MEKVLISDDDDDANMSMNESKLQTLWNWNSTARLQNREIALEYRV